MYIDFFFLENILMEVLLGKIDGLMRNHDTYFNLILMGE